MRKMHFRGRGITLENIRFLKVMGIMEFSDVIMLTELHDQRAIPHFVFAAKIYPNDPNNWTNNFTRGYVHIIYDGEEHYHIVSDMKKDQAMSLTEDNVRGLELTLSDQYLLDLELEEVLWNCETTKTEL